LAIPLAGLWAVLSLWLARQQERRLHGHGEAAGNPERVGASIR
jgi:hypothetical protein